MKRSLRAISFVCSIPLILLFECMDFYRKADPGLIKIKPLFRRNIASLGNARG